MSMTMACRAQKRTYRHLPIYNDVYLDYITITTIRLTILVTITILIILSIISDRL